MTSQQILAWATGVTFLLLLLVVAFTIYIRGGDKPVPHEAMLIFRIILALAGAGFAAVLPGFLEIEGTWQKLAIRAGGALAAFIVLYFFNPPGFVEQRVAALAKAEKRQVPRDAIENDLPDGGHRE
ncbi:MAG: hypothetical protein JOY71_03285 [Acetobacteraceae bacterium]|nr:hypothetical protein [Acetobacteraceae bacterium]